MMKLNDVYKPNNHYKVIVKTITFNHSKYIQDTLNGVAMQETNFPFVNIVLEDHSTDGEQDVIKLWLERECNMTLAEHYDIPTAEVVIVPHKSNKNCTFAVYFHKENLFHQKDKRETQIYPWRIKSEYEALCEGDDYWIDSLKLQKQVDFLDAHPEYTMCFHNAIEHWEHRDSKDKLFSTVKDQDYSGTYIYKNWIIPTASVLLRITVYNSNLYRKVTKCKDFLYGDTPLFVTCAECGKIRGLSDISSVYRKSNTGITMKSKTYADYCGLCIHVNSFYKVFGAPYYSPLFVSNTYIVSAIHLLINKDFISAKNILGQNPYKIYSFISLISVITRALIQKIRKCIHT